MRRPPCPTCLQPAGRHHPSCPDRFPARTLVNPTHEQTGIDPGVLQDLERDAMPKGWTTVDRERGPRRYFGFNALNRCCRMWMLLGWPAGDDGMPAKRTEGILTIDCQKCGKELHFDLNGTGMVVEMEQHQPPALMPGHITGLGN